MIEFPEFVLKFSNELEMSGILGEYVVHNVLDKIFNIEKDNTYKSKDDNTKVQLKNLLIKHQLKVYNFAHTLQFSGIGKPQQVKKHTIALSITRDIKQYPKGGKSVKITESKILYDNNNYFILGDPGSGKTTALKRLILKAIYNNKPKKSIDRFPIIIRFIELEEGEDFFCKIADILGLKYETRVEERIVSYLRNRNTEKMEPVKELVKVSHINNVDLKDFIPFFLNDAKIILFLDGLDEIRSSLKVNVWASIRHLLAHQSNDAKIILTCRSGEKDSTIVGFNECEISSLNDHEIEQIANVWLGKNNTFIQKLNSANYRDLADRPLFLVNLLMMYRDEDDLPINSIAVYERIINLVLWQWDKDRENIKRVSVYGSKFDIYQKLNFLRELSFHLLYKIKEKRFNSAILKKAYLSIYRRYNLIESEADLVVKEIESHNGLIVKTGFDKYEFSHISLLEYLCAEYLNRVAFNKEKLLAYLQEYPAPIGLAAAISPEPSDWLATLLADFTKVKLDFSIEDSIATIINRAISEKTAFEYSPKLVSTLIFIVNFRLHSRAEEEIIKLITLNEEMKRSFVRFFFFYKLSNHQYGESGFIAFDRNEESEHNKETFEKPSRIVITKTIFNTLDLEIN